MADESEREYRTGAKSYGFENMPHASHLARNQLIEAKKRFRLWGISGGEMECHESDFCEDSLVPKVLKKADVVLVNNEVYVSDHTLLSSLNMS